MSARYRTLLIIAVALTTSFAGAEILARALGFGSFPVYDVSDDLKYIPAADQSGLFRNKNRWVFNDRHMGNAGNWAPDKKPDVLLIGNSIVLGGLPYDRDDKLGPLLQKDLGAAYTVWSVAAGGWSNVNEMAYLDKNADVLRNSDIVVIEYMEGGLSGPTPWAGETIFPAHKPALLSVYLFQKYIVPFLQGLQPVNDAGALPPVGDPDPAQLEKFSQFIAMAAKTSRVFIFLYPDEKSLSAKERWRQIAAPIMDLCKAHQVTCIDIAQQPAWRANLYKEGIHPTIEGNKVLAQILADNILAPENK